MSEVNSKTNNMPYIDRRVAEGIFRELLGERPIYRVFSIYGKNGSGKTTFINKMKQKYIINQNIVHIEINFNNRLLHKPQSSIMHMAKELEQKYNFNFLALWKAYAILWHQRYEHSPIMYATDLPYFEEIKKLITPKQKESNVLTIAKGIFGNKLAKELEELKKLDAKSIENKLYQFFASDLRRELKKSKFKDCVIFFENIELLSEYNNSSPCAKDEWIRDLIMQIGKEALFVMTSKEKSNWQSCNSSWSQVLKEYEMKSFIKKDSLRYLALNDIKEQKLKEAIVVSSSNEPFWLTLAKIAYKTNYSKLPTNKNDILDAFKASEDKNLIQLLNILSHSRFFTKDLIDTIKEKFNLQITEHLFKKLIEASYVKKVDSQKYVLDEILKDRLIKIQDKKESVEYKAFMFSYYENRLQTIDSTQTDNLPKVIDESIEEAWYYLNSINKEPLVHFEWLDYYIDRFFMYAAWEPFLDRYNKILPHLKSAKDSVSKQKLIALYNNLAGLYESLGDTKIAKRYYDMVINLNRPKLLSA